MEKGGNDYLLAQKIREKKMGASYHVFDFKHTWEILQYENK